MDFAAAAAAAAAVVLVLLGLDIPWLHDLLYSIKCRPASALVEDHKISLLSLACRSAAGTNSLQSVTPGFVVLMMGSSKCSPLLWKQLS